ncbi:NAD(P)(+)--arginine ADP-ribosyltransferase 1-like isoform X2 [Misgurnus anguillicaudatus]|uniref:NAD(P)(+)--arginine ADP-ribosyltransferase 1-like isoform X2 n=1 Tax=Misgurnus anguillicaudatus TaxID=75329 RepID=UPI0024349D4F|nr:NAD(P)(+)--arginine ADP-ribosyltransferase 1-like [Misgurnus anguillicaudatus]
MLSTAALILILTSKVVLGQDDRESLDGQIYPLDMAENSVDDWYHGCESNMSALVKGDYLIKEICANINFGKAWMLGIEKVPRPDKLNMFHFIAISVYTSDLVYKDFNNNVRTDRQKYIDKKYTWYSLHFFLTEAIKTLRKNQGNCKETYRATSVKFIDTVKDKEIRFGSFASSSLKREKTVKFGNESCFKIKTCEGADVSKYSDYPEEEEVLIPPYEKFKVTAIKKNDWCKTVFVLESTGVKSNLNCAAASVKLKKYHNVIISD